MHQYSQIDNDQAISGGVVALQGGKAFAAGRTMHDSGVQRRGYQRSALRCAYISTPAFAFQLSYSRGAEYSRAYRFPNNLIKI